MTPVVHLPPDIVDGEDWPPTFIRTPGRFILHYMARRRWHFIGLSVLALAASGCSISVQYAIKILVNGVTT